MGLVGSTKWCWKQQTLKNKHSKKIQANASDAHIQFWSNMKTIGNNVGLIASKFIADLKKIIIPYWLPYYLNSCKYLYYIDVDDGYWAPNPLVPWSKNWWYKKMLPRSNSITNISKMSPTMSYQYHEPTQATSLWPNKLIMFYWIRNVQYRIYHKHLYSQIMTHNLWVILTIQEVVTGQSGSGKYALVYNTSFLVHCCFQLWKNKCSMEKRLFIIFWKAKTFKTV